MDGLTEFWFTLFTQDTSAKTRYNAPPLRTILTTAKLLRCPHRVRSDIRMRKEGGRRRREEREERGERREERGDRGERRDEGGERREEREEGGEGGQIPSTKTSYSQKVIDSTDLLGHNEAGESLDVPHQQEHSDIWISHVYQMKID